MDEVLGARVGPYNGIVEWFAGLVIPDDSCFALVGYSDAFYGAAEVALGLEIGDCSCDACFDGAD